MSEVVGFTAEQASRITGLSLRQLRYWDKTGFFSPSVIGTARRIYSHLYSFRNLVGLRTIALLRKKHRIPLQELRRVGSWLTEQHEAPWANLSLFVSGRHVFFEDPASGTVLDARTGKQSVFPIHLIKVASDTQKEVDRLKGRPQGEVGRIQKHRNVVHNQYVIAGTRVPVSAIWNLHIAGYKPERILSEYPFLLEEDVKSAIHFASARQKKAG
jgi:uncharacterized protein (DUF433 family)